MGQHFLPKHLYLRSFTESKDNPRIWVHERDKKSVHRHWNEVASIPELHTIQRSDGTLDRSLEDYLTVLERKLNPVIENVIENNGDGKLSIDQKQKFALFVGLMYVKTPRYFDRNKALAYRLKTVTDHALAGNKEPFLNFLKETKTDADSFFKSVKIESISDWLKDPQVYDHFHLILLEAHAFAIAKLLYEKMRWTFIIPQEQSGEYITSDNPVSICQITSQNMRDEYALAKQDGALYFPISPFLCFNAYHDEDILDKRHSALTLCFEKKFVDNLNLRSAAFAQKYAYSKNYVDLQSYFNSKNVVSA